MLCDQPLQLVGHLVLHRSGHPRQFLGILGNLGNLGNLNLKEKCELMETGVAGVDHVIVTVIVTVSVTGGTITVAEQGQATKVGNDCLQPKS